MNAWTSVARESSSREHRMRHSCHSWKKHLALTTPTCLSCRVTDLTRAGLREQRRYPIGQREQHQVSKHDRSPVSLTSCGPRCERTSFCYNSRLPGVISKGNTWERRSHWNVVPIVEKLPESMGTPFPLLKCLRTHKTHLKLRKK